MSYVSWAALYEGETDKIYYEILVPRLMEAIIFSGDRFATVPTTPALIFQRGDADHVARQICAAVNSFHIVFIHADTGGRNLERDMATRSCNICDVAHGLCNWPREQCVIIAPRHETEAWLLADPGAVCETLGYRGTPQSIGLPRNATQAERLVDPKQTLADAAVQVRGRRGKLSAMQLFPAIAQRQSLDALRRSPSFAAFEADLKIALQAIGYL